MVNLVYIKSCLGQVLLLPPATKLGQGYIFTGICHSVNRGVPGPRGVSVPGWWLVPGGSAPWGCLVPGGLLWGDAWSWGVCSWGVPGPGGCLFPGGGLPGGDLSPTQPLLWVVCILLECILVKSMVLFACSGGSKGANSFNFMQFLGNLGKIVC